MSYRGTPSPQRTSEPLHDTLKPRRKNDSCGASVYVGCGAVVASGSLEDDPYREDGWQSLISGNLDSQRACVARYGLSPTVQIERGGRGGVPFSVFLSSSAGHALNQSTLELGKTP